MKNYVLDRRGSYYIRLHSASYNDDTHDYILYTNIDIAKSREHYENEKKDSINRMILRHKDISDSTKLAKELSVCPL